MIKYIILSFIGYYIFTNYLSPMLEGQIKQNKKTSSEEKTKNNHDDEYVDYEEVE